MNVMPEMTWHKAAVVAVFFVLSGCATIPPDQRDDVRNEVDRIAQEIVDELATDDPEFQAAFDSALGFAAGRISATKLPIIGGAYGIVVLKDNEDMSRTYLDVRRFDLGAGLGVGRFRVLVLFQEREALEAFQGGTWERAVSADMAAGSSGSNVISTSGAGYSVYFLAESGAALTATARFLRTEVNHELTNTGLSSISIPNTGFEQEGEQVEFAPREWSRGLPFLAQKVVDKGYDLPLPYGIGFTYSDVEQEQLLTNLEVGFNGSEIIPLNFVSFDNAFSFSESFSLKADAWLLPFMNVFAMVGRVEGNATMDVLLDGNTVLDNRGIDCSTPPPDPACALLQDRIITLPIDASFEGNTYGIGATLAAGWKGFFVTLPINWTYADMQDSETDGASFTLTPRGGYVFNLGRYGNLAAYIGGNYLDSDLTVDGTASTEGDELVFDYIIDQDNKDKWNVLIGLNWDISKRFSISAEYNGFIGSRDAFISSLNWRY